MRLLRHLSSLALLLSAGSAHAQPALKTRLDSLVRARLASGPIAGLTVGIIKGRDTLLLKGYGKGELELSVPTPERAIYEIGSVTKQFTAVAMLKLRDAGKLSLDDPITKYLPTFDTHGNTVTVRDLLSHTSGMKSYTEMASFGPIAALALSRDTLVKLVSHEAFDFPTGTQARYNNSAYFLAGLIIEKASGQPYGDYVTQQLFKPLGMRDASYCNEAAITPRKVRGYDVAGKTLINHAWISHTWPYAAGSLCASVQDLLTWNAALHGGKVLPAASYAELIAPATLTDGTTLRYAKGLALRTIGGHRMIGHGGAIPGYLAESEYYPDNDLTVVVLANTSGPVSPNQLGVDLAMLVLGRKPTVDSTFVGSRATLVGTYVGAARGAPLIARIDTTAVGLTIVRNGGKPEPLHYVGGDTWTREEDRLRFVSNGSSREIRYDAGSGYYFLKRQP
jgi:CubicO group peptidase (beta-lactamase class C family)